MNRKLLLVDDDVEMTALLKELLKLEDFTVEIAHNGTEALAKFNDDIELVLLDIMMPEINGLNVITQLRAKYTVPIILLTAKDDTLDKIIGLELGADDYIVKPFNDRELIARIRSTLRRKYWGTISKNSDDVGKLEYIVDGLRVDVRQRLAYFDNKYIELTETEFNILLKLLEKSGNIISRDVLSESVLGKTFLPFDRSIDVHVSNLRKKLPPRKDGLPWIKTWRSKGYLLVTDNEFL